MTKNLKPRKKIGYRLKSSILSPRNLEQQLEGLAGGAGSLGKQFL